MGHNSSRGNEQIEISINHPKFVKSKITNQNKKQILRITVPCDEKAYKTWKELGQKYKALSHEYLLLPLSHKYNSTGLCASRGQVEISYDNYPYLLTDEIYHRKGKKVPFTEPQLWYLLYAYLSAKKYLEQQGDYPFNLIGDIRPQNVFINQNGQVKFSNMLSWPGERVNYRKTFDGITTYLSPEDYELLQLGSMNNEKNEKSQFFSIGFTLISAAILKDNSDVYNIEKQKLDEYEAKKRINAFKCSTIYSELLRAIISSLCSFQIKRRVELQDLWIWITKYERRIMTKQPFMIDQVPPKINEHINILRTQILAIQPTSSVLNLNSIKSLKGSIAKNQNSDIAQERMNIKTLKEVQKGSVVEKQMEKRNSRIVLNAGNQQKVFYSPTNDAYFTSKVSEKSQISQLRSQVGNAQSRVPSFYSPPSRLKNQNFKYEPHQLSKSPQGYYSPKGSGNFRIFIQYKSPSKPIEKPYAQTVYIGKDGKTQSVTVIQSMEVIQKLTKKESDSKSQKSQRSGDSNRQNRFIEQTRKQSQQKGQLYRNPQVSKNQLQTETFKKQSPIHKIVTQEEAVNHGVSEVVSEEIILPRNNEKLEGQQKTEAVENRRQINDFQIQFKSKENLAELQSKPTSRSELYNQKIEQLKARPNEQKRDITSQYLQNFHGLTPVKRESSKRISLQDSKHFEEQISRSQDMKRIEAVLTQSDQQRHALEQQIFRMTHNDGRHTVPPTKQSVESDSVKFQILQRHQDTPNISRNIGQNIPSYDVLVAEIFPVSKKVVKRKRTLSEIEVEKHKMMEEEIQKKCNQIQLSQRGLVNNDSQEIINLESAPQDNKDVTQPQQSPPQFVTQIDLITNLQKEVLDIGNQIVDLRNNFQIQTQSPPVGAFNEQSPQKILQQTTVVQQLSTEEVIQNEISSQKEQSDLKPMEQSHHLEVKVEQNIINVGIVDDNHRNILILDEQTDNQQEHNKVATVTQQITSFQKSEYENVGVLDDRPLLPLGPEKHQTQMAENIEHVEHIQRPNIENVQHIQTMQNVPQKDKIETLINQQVILLQNQVEGSEQIIESLQKVVAEQTKSLKSPSQQNEHHQEPSQFHQSHIDSIVPLQQRVIQLQQQSSKLSQNKIQHQLQYAKVTIQEQPAELNNEARQLYQEVAEVSLNINNVTSQEKPAELNNEARQLYQEVADVSLNPNNTVTSYKTVEYHHQISLGGSGSGEKIVYNVIEVNQNSLPLENGMINDSDIIGSGKMRSKVIIDESQIANVEQQNRILPQQKQLQKQDQPGNQPEIIDNKIEQQSQNLILNQPTQQNDVAQRKVRDISPNDPFLEEVEQTNRKLQYIQKQQSIQKIVNQPADLNNLQNQHQPQLQPLNPVISSSANQQTQPQVQKLEAAVGQVTTQAKNLTNQSDPLSNSKSLTGSQIKNSLIQFDVVKEVVGASKQLSKYEVIYEQNKIIQVKDNLQGKDILPVDSNPNQLSENPAVSNGQRDDKAERQDQTEIRQLQITVVEPENLLNDEKQNSPSEGKYLNFTNLQVTVPGAPTESQFGNISQIMDINKDFSNTLNTKERHFLEGTSDPRSEEFFRQLVNLSQKGVIQEQDLQRVRMTIQDRDKLATFMRKWQQLNPQEEQNMQQYIDEFRQAITRSQIDEPTRQNEQAKLRMSAQDKQTLKIVVEKLNEKNSQFELTPSDKKYPINYDQSYVNVECSEMKTDTLVVYRQGQKDKKQDSQPQTEAIQQIANVLAQNFQRMSQEFEENKPKQTESNDIITEVIEINRSLNDKVPEQKDLGVLQSGPVDRQLTENYSTQANAPNNNLQSQSLKQMITQAIQQHSDRGAQHNNNEQGFFSGVLNQIKSAASNLKEIVEDVIGNQENQQNKGSQVDASAGQKSEREDPTNQQLHKYNNSQNEKIENLHILKSHRTYSQPNNILDRASLRGELLNNETKINHTTIVEEAQELEGHLAGQIVGYQAIQMNRIGNGLIQQITEINKGIEDSVDQHIVAAVSKVEEKIVELQISRGDKEMNVQAEVKNSPARGSQRRSRPMDFLDEVMQVNKIVNHEQDKDYQKDNKYLNTSKDHTQ